MMKLTMVLLFVAVLALVGRTDRDGRIAGGDLVARTFGYVLRVEVTLRRTEAIPRSETFAVDVYNCMLPDSMTRAVIWR